MIFRAAHSVSANLFIYEHWGWWFLHLPTLNTKYIIHEKIDKIVLVNTRKVNFLYKDQYTYRENYK